MPIYLLLVEGLRLLRLGLVGLEEGLENTKSREDDRDLGLHGQKQKAFPRTLIPNFSLSRRCIAFHSCSAPSLYTTINPSCCLTVHSVSRIPTKKRINETHQKMPKVYQEWEKLFSNPPSVVS